MTFTLDSRKFEYVEQPKSGSATPAKAAKRREPEQQGQSAEPEAADANAKEE